MATGGTAGRGGPADSLNGMILCMILVLDNYDSFTYNLGPVLASLGRSRTCAGMTR